MATLASSERKWTTSATEDNLLQGDAGERKWDPSKVACPWKIDKICRHVFKGVNLPCKSIYDVYIYIYQLKSVDVSIREPISSMLP